jgi:hypothetical protein
VLEHVTEVKHVTQGVTEETQENIVLPDDGWTLVTKTGRKANSSKKVSNGGS